MSIIHSILNDEMIRGLNHIKRFSFSPVIRPENVSEHSFWVSYYSYLVAQSLSNKYKIDIGKVLIKAVVHDIEEAGVGDIVRTFKYSSPELTANVKKAEYRQLKNYVNKSFDAEISNRIIADWQKSKDKSIEGRIVAFCDFLCVFVYCCEEIKTGNKHMLQVLSDAYTALLKKDFGKELNDYKGELMFKMSTIIMES
jgi:putative hydrolase of HD superfamily